MAKLKTKEYLVDVIRIDNDSVTRHGKIRLDKSERVNLFEKHFFDKFKENLTQEDFICYPEVFEIKDKIQNYHNLNDLDVHITSGSDAIIKSFFEIADNSKKVIITNPCFPMYKVYAQLFNMETIDVGYNKNLVLDVDKLLDSIDSNVGLVAIANPISPVGDVISESAIYKIAKKCSNLGIPLLIDEAYYEFYGTTAIPLCEEFTNVGVARTFSKALGGAGVRLAYLIGSRELISCVKKWRPMYEVNQVAIKYGCFILDNIEQINDYVKRTVLERDGIYELLKGNNVEVINTQSNWVHVNCKNIDKVIKVLEKNNVLFKCGTLPYQGNTLWLRLTIFPNLSKTSYFQEIMNLNK